MFDLGAIINVELDQLEEWEKALERNSDMHHTAEAVKDATQESYAQTRRNLSGEEVPWSGGSFTINRVTGNLFRSAQMEWPAGDQFSGEVIIGDTSTPYAKNILRGITGPERVRQIIWGGQGPDGFSQKGPHAGRAYKRIPIRLFGGAQEAKRQASRRTGKKYGPDFADPEAASAGIFRAGRKGHSRWFSLITITEDTIWPDMEARPVDKATADQMRDRVHKIVTDGFKKDLFGGLRK